MKRKILITLASIVLALVLLLTFAYSAFAMADPSSVNLESITVYKDMITSGDLLAIVPYSVTFATNPGIAIGNAFLFQMISENGTYIGAATPYPFNELGYGSGIISFYISSGGVWDEAYTFRVRESPAYYPSPQYWDFNIGPANYTPGTDQTAALQIELFRIAALLSTEYSTTLLTTDQGITKFSTYGELYFQNAIPGLSVMCPGLFSVEVRTPDFTKHSWDYTLANTLATRYNGTFIGDFMTGFAGLTSTDTSTTMNIFSIILFAILIFVAVKWGRANTYAALLDGYALLLLLMFNGFFSMILAGLIAFILLVVGGGILFLNRA